MKEIAIGYARLSDKDSSNNSIASQGRRIREYCALHNLELARIFEDNDKSGWTFNRPGFIELEQYCKQNKNVKYLIVRHFDRFSRTDAIDAMTKEKYFHDKLGVKVLQVSERPDLDTTDPYFKLIRFIQAFKSHQERQDGRDRTLNGINDRLTRGFYCRKAPYGYVNTEDHAKNKIIAIDESAAPVVRLIFDEYNAGFPIEQVRKLAVQAGFKCKGNSAIQRILSNPTYAGLLHVFAYKGKPARLVKGNHTAIVSETAYWLAQERLNGKKYARHAKETVPLRGVLKHHCGNLFTAGNSKGKKKYYWYYLCNCDRKSFSAEKLHAQFYEMLHHFSYTPAALEYLTNKVRSIIHEHLSKRETSLITCESELSQVQKKIAEVEERYLLGNVSEGTFKKVIAGLRSDEASLQARIATLGASERIIWQRFEETMPHFTDIPKCFSGWELPVQQRFVNQVFDRSLYYANGCYRTPFLHPLFSHNAVALSEKRLLLIERMPIQLQGQFPSVPQTGIEPVRPFRVTGF
jgi:site-specific DNA recombinase